MPDANNSTPRPKTGPQQPGAGGTGFASSLTDLTGFGAPRKGDYKTYRQIGGDPTVALGMAIICQPIIRGGWSWTTKADKKDAGSGGSHTAG